MTLGRLYSTSLLARQSEVKKKKQKKLYIGQHHEVMGPKYETSY